MRTSAHGTQPWSPQSSSDPQQEAPATATLCPGRPCSLPGHVAACAGPGSALSPVTVPLRSKGDMCPFSTSTPDSHPCQGAVSCHQWGFWAPSWIARWPPPNPSGRTSASPASVLPTACTAQHHSSPCWWGPDSVLGGCCIPLQLFGPCVASWCADEHSRSVAPGSASTGVDTGPTRVMCVVTVATSMAVIPSKARQLAGARHAPLPPEGPCLQVAFLQERPPATSYLLPNPKWAVRKATLTGGTRWVRPLPPPEAQQGAPCSVAALTCGPDPRAHLPPSPLGELACFAVRLSRGLGGSQSP